jgi:hypothetical protein
MDTEYVLQMSQRFGQISNICNTIVNIVNTIQQILRASAFIGMIGNYAAASTLEPFKKGLKELGDKLGEVGRDVASARDMFINGDTKGSKRFC